MLTLCTSACNGVTVSCWFFLAILPSAASGTRSDPKARPESKQYFLSRRPLIRRQVSTMDRMAVILGPSESAVKKVVRHDWTSSAQISLESNSIQCLVVFASRTDTVLVKDPTCAMRRRIYCAFLNSRPNGVKESLITCSSPTATTVIRETGKYFRPAALTSVAEMFSTFSPVFQSSSAGSPYSQNFVSASTTALRDCD